MASSATKRLTEEKHPLYGKDFRGDEKEHHRILANPKDQNALRNRLLKKPSLVNLNSPRARIYQHLASSSPIPKARTPKPSMSRDVDEEEGDYEYDKEDHDDVSSEREEYMDSPLASSESSDSEDFVKIRKKISTSRVKFDNLRGNFDPEEKKQLRAAEDLDDDYDDDDDEYSSSLDGDYDPEFVVADDSEDNIEKEQLLDEEEEEYRNAEQVVSNSDESSEYSDEDDDVDTDDLCDESSGEGSESEEDENTGGRFSQYEIEQQEKSRLRRQAQPTFGDLSIRGVINSIVSAVYNQKTSVTVDIDVKTAINTALLELRNNKLSPNIYPAQRQVVDSFKAWIIARKKLRETIMPVCQEFNSFNVFFQEILKMDNVEYHSDVPGKCFATQKATDLSVTIFKTSQKLTTLHYSKEYEGFISGLIWCWLLPNLLDKELVTFMTEVKELPIEQRPRTILNKRSAVSDETTSSFINFFLTLNIIKIYSESLPVQ